MTLMMEIFETLVSTSKLAQLSTQEELSATNSSLL
jgi:hypothetical protein